MPKIIDIAILFGNRQFCTDCSWAVFGDPPLPPMFKERFSVDPWEIEELQAAAIEAGLQFINLSENTLIQIGVVVDDEFKDSYVIIFSFSKQSERFKDFAKDVDMVRGLPSEVQNESIRRIAIADYNGKVYRPYKKPPHPSE